MDFALLLAELPKLDAEQRQLVLERLTEAPEPDEEESPEALAAIDEALALGPESRVWTLAEAFAEMDKWATR